MTFKVLPKWKNSAKSGHTGRRFKSSFRMRVVGFRFIGHSPPRQYIKGIENCKICITKRLGLCFNKPCGRSFAYFRYFQMTNIAQN